MGSVGCEFQIGVCPSQIGIRKQEEICSTFRRDDRRVVVVRRAQASKTRRRAFENILSMWLEDLEESIGHEIHPRVDTILNRCTTRDDLLERKMTELDQDTLCKGAKGNKAYLYPLGNHLKQAFSLGPVAT